MHPVEPVGAVAVGVVVHDLPGAYAQLGVDLPEDDAAVAGGPEVVVFVDAPEGVGLRGEAPGEPADEARPGAVAAAEVAPVDG